MRRQPRARSRSNRPNRLIEARYELVTGCGFTAGIARKQGFVAVDTETTGVMRGSDLLASPWRWPGCVYVPLRHGAARNL